MSKPLARFATVHWHALLRPVAHHGECNHLARGRWDGIDPMDLAHGTLS